MSFLKNPVIAQRKRGGYPKEPSQTWRIKNESVLKDEAWGAI
jgi:hypothetical protein